MHWFFSRRCILFIFMVAIFALGLLFTGSLYPNAIMIDAYLWTIPPLSHLLAHILVIVFLVTFYYMRDQRKGYPKFICSISNKTPCRILFLFLMLLYFFLSFVGFTDYSSIFLYILISLGLLAVLLYILLFNRKGKSRFAKPFYFLFYTIPDRWFDLIATTGAFIFLVTLKHIFFSDISIVSDTNSQIAHARIFVSGQWFLENPLSGKDIVHFINGITNSRIYSQYPPGFTLFLYPFQLLNIVHLAGPLAGALTVPVLRRMGNLVDEKGSGRLAVLLLLFSPFWIVMSVEGMNHTLSLFLLTVMLYCLFTYWKNKTPFSSLIAGAALGGILITRPMNALIYGFMAFVTLVAVRNRHVFVKGLAAFSVGVIPFLLFLGYFNFHTTGSPWIIGYILQDPEIHQLGLLENGEYTYTMHEAISRQWANIFSLNEWLLPLSFGAVWLGACWLLKKGKNNLEYLLLTCIFLQGGGYFLYHFHDLFLGPRFWYEMLVPAMVLIAATWHPLVREAAHPTTGITSNNFPASFITLFITGSLLVGLYADLPQYLEKFAPMVARGTAFRESFEEFQPRDQTILFVPEYYQEWSWVFYPPAEELNHPHVVYAEIQSDKEYSLLREELTEWEFYEFDAETNSWLKVRMDEGP